jgi:hypothetical protein
MTIRRIVERTFPRWGRREFTMGLGALVVSLCPGPGVAHAEGAAVANANATLMVLLATQADGGAIDPAIGPMPQLAKPPFSAYNSYKLLEKASLHLEQGKPVTQALPNGRTLQVTLVEAKGEKRYRVAAAINQANGQAFVKLMEVTAVVGEPFFVAGQAYQGGTLVLGIALKP